MISAADYAERKARLNRASRWYDAPAGQAVPAVPSPEPLLSRLWHDIEQLLYLERRRILSKVLPGIIDNYRTVVDSIGNRPFNRRSLTALERSLIGDVYGRILWKAHAPRSPSALSHTWSRDVVERAYFDQPIGVVVVDDFLTPDAVTMLRRFCIESTIWFQNRYNYRRLSAFFRDGFNCPLLVQVAEELRAQLPRIVGAHSLQQLWAFKNEPVQPTTLPHADFAMVNVNFWLAPDEANLDRHTGGMIIYDVSAPRGWKFDKYNKRGDVIAQYLLEQNARAVRIPYRANRAIIFDSRYFHKTDALDFSPEFENRRVNVTLLFGRHDRA